MARRQPTDFAGKRFPVNTLSLVPLGLLVIAVYGGGIAAAGWAASLTAKAMRGEGGEIPYGPWALAFALIILGMLSVIYLIFFRPREVRVSEDEVKLALWDGSGKAVTRAQLEDCEAGASRIVLRGGGKRMVIDNRYQPWEDLRKTVEAWAGKAKA